MRRALVLCALAACSGPPSQPAAGDDAGVDAASASLEVGGDVSASTVSFADALIGARSTATVSLTNVGALATGPLTMSVAAPFMIQPSGTTCAGALAPGDTCTIIVAFAPTTVGLASGELDVFADPGGTLAIQLIGNGLVSPIILDTTSLDFGEINQDTGWAVRSVHVTNNGSVAAALSTKQSNGGAAVLFHDTTCTATLAPGETCEYRIAYGPTGPGVLHQDYAITADGTDYVVALTTIGVGSLTVLRAGHPYAGTVTSTQPGIDCSDTTCTASFSGPIHLVATPKPNATFVAWSDPTCGTSPTCDLPASLADRHITASFHDPAFGADSLYFSGDYGFGLVRAYFGGTHDANATTTITVVNALATPVDVLDVYIDQAYSWWDWSIISTTCIGTLAGNASCSIVVKFAPQEVGEAGVQIRVHTSGSDFTTGVVGTGSGLVVTYGSNNGSIESVAMSRRAIDSGEGRIIMETGDPTPVLVRIVPAPGYHLYDLLDCGANSLMFTLPVRRNDDPHCLATFEQN